jgi:hypothetical protein
VQVQVNGDTMAGAMQLLLSDELPVADRSLAEVATTDDGVVSSQASEAKLRDVRPDTRLSFQWDRTTGRSSLKLSGAELSPRHFEALLVLNPETGSLPAPLNAAGWNGRGTFDWQRIGHRQPGEWSGQLAVASLPVSIPGLLPEALLESGRLRFQPASWTVEAGHGLLKDAAFQAEMAYVSEDPRPYRLALTFDELKLSEVAADLFASPPAQAGFLRRALGRTGTRTANIRPFRGGSAKIYAASVLINGDKYDRLRGEIFWDHEGVSVENISFASRFGEFQGIVRCERSAESPRWQASFAGKHGDWEDGTLQVELQRHAHGGLASLWTSASTSAELSWAGPSLEEGGRPTVLRATLRWPDSKTEPEICDQCVELRDGRGVWLGSCYQSNGTGYRCLLSDPRTSQQLELELPVSMVGSGAQEW